MAKQPKNPTATQFKKFAKAEDDTVRAAHFLRCADGHRALEPLTAKNTEKRDKRNALIKELPPVVPIIEVSSGPVEPQTNDMAKLRAENEALKATIEERDAQIDDLTKPVTA